MNWYLFVEANDPDHLGDSDYPKQLIFGPFNTDEEAQIFEQRLENYNWAYPVQVTAPPEGDGPIDCAKLRMAHLAIPS
jgi:hypothetical protein